MMGQSSSKSSTKLEPMMVTSAGGECGVPMERRFQMPFPAVGDQWYSFDYGPIHFLQTSTEQPFGAGSPQWQFVVNDLMQVNRSITPWVVVSLSITRRLRAVSSMIFFIMNRIAVPTRQVKNSAFLPKLPVLYIATRSHSSKFLNDKEGHNSKPKTL